MENVMTQLGVMSPPSDSDLKKVLALAVSLSGACTIAEASDLSDEVDFLFEVDWRLRDYVNASALWLSLVILKVLRKAAQSLES